MTHVKDRLESALRLFAAGICVCSVGLLSSLTMLSPNQIPLPVVFFLIVSAGCAFIVFAGGLGTTMAGGLGGVIAISISIAMANASEISPTAMTVFTMLTMTVLVVVGRIAGGSKFETKQIFTARREEPVRSSTRLVLDHDSPIWETTHKRPETSALMGLITQDFCHWLTDQAHELKLDEETEGQETFLRLNDFASGPLRQRLHARHIAVGWVDSSGTWSDVSGPSSDDTAMLPPPALKKLAAEQPFIQDLKGSELASRKPQWILPIPGKPAAALCVFGVLDEHISPRTARSLTDLVRLFTEHLRGLKALREARASFDTLAASFAIAQE